MIKTVKKILAAMAVFAFAALPIFAQKVGFISSQTIRDKYPEAQQSALRIQSQVDEWKRDLDNMQKDIETLEQDIKKNRLLWGDDEKKTKDKELETKRKERSDFAKAKFSTGGEYDKVTTEIMKPIEEKVYAATQKVAAEEGYDIIWDKSSLPLVYANLKYDLTLKVMKELGIKVEELEEAQKKAIETDPRNSKEKSSVKPPSSRRRSRSGSDDAKEEPKNPDIQPIEQPKQEESKLPETKK